MRVRDSRSLKLYPPSRSKNDWTTNTNSQKQSIRILRISASVRLSALEDSAFRLDKLVARSLIGAASVPKLAVEAFKLTSSCFMDSILNGQYWAFIDTKLCHTRLTGR
jgi:hypothetical protein